MTFLEIRLSVHDMYLVRVQVHNALKYKQSRYTFCRLSARAKRDYANAFVFFLSVIRFAWETEVTYCVNKAFLLRKTHFSTALQACNYVFFTFQQNTISKNVLQKRHQKLLHDQNKHKPVFTLKKFISTFFIAMGPNNQLP